MLEVTGGSNQGLDLISGQDDGQLFGSLGKRDIVHRPRAMQGLLIEKAQAANGLGQDACANLLIEKME